VGPPMEAEAGQDTALAAGGGSEPGVIRDGTAQPDRFPAPLGEGYFAVDEMSLADLISMSAEIASNIRYDPEASSVESWADLYVEEPAFVLAELASFPAPAYLSRLHELRSNGDLHALALYVRSLAARLRYWSGVLSKSADPRILVLSRRTESTVADLAADRLAWIFFVDPGPRYEAGRSVISSPWAPFSRELRHEVRPPDRTEDPDELLRRFDFGFFEVGRQLLSTISYLKSASCGMLEEVLSTKTHDPALGLSLAFLRLFATAQQRINEFSRRRLEFYYFDVLGFEPRAGVPDWAHLALSPAPGTTEVLVPRGTEFSAGRDEREAELVFVSGQDFLVTDARVESLRTLFFDKDRLVSPESELDFVTGIRAAQVDHDQFDAGSAEELPLFGSTDPDNASARDTEADLGFAVASPLLHLSEGKRRIQFHIELGNLEFVMDAGASTAEALTDRQIAIDRLGACESPDDLYAELGRIFTNELMSASPWLSRAPEDGSDTDAIRATVARVLGHDSEGRADVIARLFERDRRGLFYELFRHSLRVSFTGNAGWEAVPQQFIGPREDGVGLQVVLELGPEAGPIVPYDPDLHGAEYVTDLPVMTFRVSADALFHPYSVLRALDLKRIEIEIEVSGATDIIAYNKQGPLDPTKSFQPFGPSPSRDSALIVGCYQAAKKKLTRARLEIEWGELPREAGGWRTHYIGYDDHYSDDTFQAEVSVSRDRGWHPTDPDRSTRVPLFTTGGRDDRLQRHQKVNLDVLDFFKPLSPTISKEEFRATPQDGLFRLSLEPSRADFGHRSYPSLLTRAVQANAKRKRPEPEPRPPYTPIIDRLSFSYTARSVITLGSAHGGLADRAREKIFHDYPFGAHDLTDASFDQRFSLMPGGPEAVNAQGERILHDGYLFVGLSGTKPAGKLTLLVQMVRSATQATSTATSGMSWYYLASNRWYVLDPEWVVDDTTNGLQRSGLVTLDVPRAINRDNTVLPSDLYWLAVGARNLESATTRLQSVSAGGIRVVWEDRGNVRPSESTVLPPGTIQGLVSPVVGLGEVKQVGSSCGGSPAESYDRLITRVSERLRHKNRAITPWDYERLVLEAFPEVFKVKCFPNTDVERYPDVAPGSVLIVAVPRLSQPSPEAWRMQLLGGTELARIEEALRSIAPPSARITVRNPTYELVQVRCQVKLAGRGPAGLHLQQVSQALIDFIAPWNAEGRGGRFGWVIREKDVAAFIHGLPFVDFVTDLSLLHVSENEGLSDRFRKHDTAHVFEDTAIERVAEDAVDATRLSASHPRDEFGRTLPENEVRSRYPWSLALPSARHFIVVGEHVVTTEAKIRGVGELEIGQNFILEPKSE
jgi:hypothetical protein